ncbi:MAG: OmpA family protein [Paludibacteraceae bacterium]|nr:OmpA family protein [Paludibacteraceae bacterium]
MKKYVFIILYSLFIISASAQITLPVPTKMPQLRTLEAKGWSVQHAQMAFDSLSIVFAATEPGKNNSDLYCIRAEGWRWGQPQRLDEYSSPEDELWPTLATDNQTIYFIRRTPADPSDKHSFEKTRIYKAQKGSVAPLIISSEQDWAPRILEDNTTLIFYRRAESKKHDGPWECVSSEALDSHNWMLPVLMSEQPAPKPIKIITGTVNYAKGGRPLSSGEIHVYNAITQQLLQTSEVHGVTGRFRIALQAGEQYRLDITAKGFSHHYVEVDTRELQQREEQEIGAIPLSERLQLTVKMYDSQTQEFIGQQQFTLPLDSLHSLPLHQSAFRDTVLTINTTRQLLFDRTEIDVALTPKKSLHRFRATNMKTGETVNNCTITLDGYRTKRDTAMRLNREVALQVSAPGFLLFDTVFNTGKQEEEKTINLPLQPIEKDLVVQLRNIQFAYDSHELTYESDKELEQLLALLRMNPTMRIELSAHTDDRGNDKYNDRLSTLRGEAVLQWLAEKGIDTSRIKTVGYGKRKPLVPNTSDENRALNRRVEIKVLEL